jgi:hypothetical protein
LGGIFLVCWLARPKAWHNRFGFTKDEVCSRHKSDCFPLPPQGGWRKILRVQ